MDLHYQGVLGLLILILDVWAIISVVNSSRSVGNKVIWVILIMILPVLGAILWLLIGPRSSLSTR